MRKHQSTGGQLSELLLCASLWDFAFLFFFNRRLSGYQIMANSAMKLEPMIPTMTPMAPAPSPGPTYAWATAGVAVSKRTLNSSLPGCLDRESNGVI